MLSYSCPRYENVLDEWCKCWKQPRLIIIQFWNNCNLFSLAQITPLSPSYNFEQFQQFHHQASTTLNNLKWILNLSKYGKTFQRGKEGILKSWPGWDIPGEAGSQGPTKSSSLHEIFQEIHEMFFLEREREREREVYFPSDRANTIQCRSKNSLVQNMVWNKPQQIW